MNIRDMAISGAKKSAGQANVSVALIVAIQTRSRLTCPRSELKRSVHWRNMRLSLSQFQTHLAHQ